MEHRWYAIAYVKDSSIHACLFGYRAFLDDSYDNDKFVYASGDTPDEAEKAAQAKAALRRKSKELED